LEKIRPREVLGRTHERTHERTNERTARIRLYARPPYFYFINTGRANKLYGVSFLV